MNFGHIPPDVSVMQTKLRAQSLSRYTIYCAQPSLPPFLTIEYVHENAPLFCYSPHCSHNGNPVKEMKNVINFHIIAYALPKIKIDKLRSQNLEGVFMPINSEFTAGLKCF